MGRSAIRNPQSAFSEEEAVLFGETSSLVGVITSPPFREDSRDLTAVLLLNAGRTHRVGPNRLHVKIARTLAAMGFVVLRFDFSGVGDSRVRDDNLPFGKSALAETQEAMNYLSASRNVERFVLMGICSGGAISFKAACCDPRVVGAVIINGRNHLHHTNGESDSYIRNRALLRHYLRIAFFSSFRGKNWLKAVAANIDYRAILKVMMSFSFRSVFIRQGKATPDMRGVQVDIQRLTERGVRLLHIYSEGDEGLDYFHLVVDDTMQKWHTSRLLNVEVIRGANHAFTLLWSQEELFRIIGNFMQGFVKQ